MPIITPIDEEGSDIREEADAVIDRAIVPALRANGYKHYIVAHRIIKPGRITNDIFTLIEICDLVIANLSYLKPNVMYELGARHATGKPIIHICNHKTGFPFDTADVRRIEYKNIIGGELPLIEKLTDAIRKAMSPEKLMDPINQAKSTKKTMNDAKKKQLIEKSAFKIEE